MFDSWVGKIPWRRKCNPLQYSCLDNPLGRGAWQAAVHDLAAELETIDFIDWKMVQTKIKFHGKRLLIYPGRQAVRLIWRLLSRTGPLLWRAIIRRESREGTKATSDWASCKVIFIFANSSDSHINCVIETFFYSHFVVEETKFEQHQYINLPRTHIYQSKELRLMWSKLQTAFTPIITCWLKAHASPRQSSAGEWFTIYMMPDYSFGSKVPTTHLWQALF